MSKILLVDDKLDHLEKLRQWIQGDNREVVCATTREDALVLINDNDFDIVVTDLALLGDDDPQPGLDVLNAAKEKDPSTEVIVITFFPRHAMFPHFWGLELGARAMGLGAFDYIEKGDLDNTARELICAKITEALESRNEQFQVVEKKGTCNG